MTAFSLFQRPYFQRKISNINSPVQRKALLASIFSFSARFCRHDSTKTQPTAQAQSQVRIPSSSRFHEIALHSIEASLEECQDGIPPLCVLQALILTTFLQLIQGVRGRAWRSLGTCVRIAYELQLHLVDAEHDEMDTIGTGHSVERWSSDEERRRAWWAVWEFDVFASTVRRLPTAIDWTQNETFLPVEDELWFSDQFSPSCRLDHDPTARWKKLEKCGNQSPKAWYIVVNSIMRNAQLFSNPRGLNSVSRPMERTNTTFATALDHEPSELVKSELMVLGNTLGCVMMALPPSLAHEEEYLSFIKPSRQMDSAKHGIHIMIQLARFMIHHYEVFWTTNRDGSFAIDVGPELGESSVVRNAEPTVMSARYSWSRYLEAADRIISLVRNCSSNQYVHRIIHDNVSDFLKHVLLLPFVEAILF
jgi:Fungal specific transcription factor domain